MAERKSKIKILGDSILIKRDPLPEKKIGLIYLPDAYAGREQKVRDRGEIVLVGDKIKHIKDLTVGKRVIFGRFSYQDFNKDENLILVKECDILVVGEKGDF